MGASLGIDIGTSKVACVVLSPDGAPLFHNSRPTQAEINTLSAGHIEQSTATIIKTLKDCVTEIPHEVRTRISVIGVTGQMHGVVLWNTSSEEVSNLVTWQDQRCIANGFIDNLRRKTGDTAINTGYGCATLSWYAQNNPEFISRFNSAGTIHDYVVALLCGLDFAYTDYTDAASWGLFSLSSLSWSNEALTAAEFPTHLLPKIQPPGSMAGRLNNKWAEQLGLTAGISVAMAIGDNQASLFATLQNPDKDLAITVGTGAQASLVISSLESLPANLPSALEVRPFVDDKFIVVGASLCGGKAFAWLRETLHSWCKDLGLTTLDDKTLYARLDELGQAHLDSPLRVCSSLQGERYNSELRGSISNLTLDNFSLGNLSAALVRSIFENLRDMFPTEILEEKDRLVGSGNGIRRLKLAQILCENVFRKPLVLSSDEEEAASGAAKLALRLMN